MPTTFKMEGIMVEGELYVRETDCRRAVNDAMTAAKNAERGRCADEIKRLQTQLDHIQFPTQA